MSRRILGASLLLGGGAAAIGAVLYGAHKSTQTTDAITKAVDAPPVALPLTPATQTKLPTVLIHGTGYWPKSAKVNEKLMEGGLFDRKMPAAYKNQPDSKQYKDHLLHTVEEYLSGQAEFVSLSGDDLVWPYGQKLIFPWVDGQTIIGRVVDTGSHFRGITKVYRVFNEEPVDICVDSSKTIVPKHIVAQIVPGDNFQKGKAVATSRILNQTVALRGDDLQEGRTAEDREALARALESELAGRSNEELTAAAWSIRNRADASNTSIYKMLAPNGEYGSPQKSGGYASTRRAPSDTSKSVASAILDAPKSEDVTNGAIDFWVPEQQARMRRLGDVYRAAARSGDDEKAEKYAQYAGYGSEGDVRVQQARDGLRVLKVVGVIEILGKV